MSKLNFHYGYVIVFCCCLIMGVIIGLVISCAGIFYTPVSADLSVSKGDFGLYMTFVYACSFFMLSVAGKMMDKFSARWLLTLSSGVVGLVHLAMSQFGLAVLFGRCCNWCCVGISTVFELSGFNQSLVQYKGWIFHWFVQCRIGNWRRVV